MGHNEQIFDINKQVAKIAAETGAKVALEMVEKEKRKAIKEHRDLRLHNTMMLLKNYRMLKEHCESAVYEAASLDARYDEIMELMESVFADDSFSVESIKRSAERTFLIVRHIDEMLSLYEHYCVNTGKDEDRRRFNCMYLMYICDEPMSVQDIAKHEHIDRRTVYKDIKSASQKLTALFFGVDGLDSIK